MCGEPSTRAARAYTALPWALHAQTGEPEEEEEEEGWEEEEEEEENE